MDLQVLDEATWRARAEAHASRVDGFVGPHLARRREGRNHPVHDFLFTYYSQRPAQLRRWHPGYGVALASAPEYHDLKGYRDGTVSAEYVAAHSTLIDSIRRLLKAAAGRPAHLGCFGLHEWAMVHRATESTEGTRHPWPLRLGPAGTDQVVESHRISCS
ncbi:MAG: 3-methyladenine DNA glycosylase, partial [Nocardioides sp.]